MKAVILAGGMGTRLSEETDFKPKPMVEIGEKPILWHIMKTYSYYGINDFIICLGCKGYLVKEYFSHYLLHQTDVTVDLKANNIEFHDLQTDKWRVTLVDTGLHTMTGGRIKKIQKYIGNEPFMLTYGDGVGNVNIKDSLEFHKRSNKLATVTVVQPMGRFGVLGIDDNDNVLAFQEKPKIDGRWSNAGFFVLEPDVFEYIEGDETVWEREPLETLAKERQLAAYKHFGFWKPMDTLRDKRDLEAMWSSGKADWKVWD